MRAKYNIKDVCWPKLNTLIQDFTSPCQGWAAMYSLLCSLSFMQQEVQYVKGLRDAKVTIGLSGRKHLTHDICKLKEYILRMY